MESQDHSIRYLHSELHSFLMFGFRPGKSHCWHDQEIGDLSLGHDLVFDDFSQAHILVGCSDIMYVGPRIILERSR